MEPYECFCNTVYLGNVKRDRNYTKYEYVMFHIALVRLRGGMCVIK